MASNTPDFEVGESPRPLLTVDDPPPFDLINPGGASSFLLVCDHAGNRVPQRLGTLGLDDAALRKHIAWDLGASELSVLLSDALDAPLIRQTYSRLVVDCNRGPDAPDAIAEVSDGIVVPGNRDLSAADRAARFAEIHEPYQSAIASAISANTTIVAIHSFTPEMNGVARPWEVGILHHRGRTDFALAVLQELTDCVEGPVGDNEPYAMDKIDYTVPRHAYSANLPYVEIEVRQDVLSTPEGRSRISALLATVLQKCRP
ncbi:MAG: N-formylglutamate amidohydrolase [Sphingomonadales bacterium]|nr:N-formylglutamate amidohydrolase [Sphingomonadales bacterium]